MTKYIIIAIVCIGAPIGLSYAFGWIGVHQTLTIGKAQQNADRVVYEETQSYVDGKRQEALKMFKEYKKSDLEGKAAIREMASHSFAAFDENKLNGAVYDFIYDCKYN